MNTSIYPKKHRSPWSTQEINNLHKEYQIEELTIRQIAKLHERTYKSIINRLIKEKIIPNLDDARGAYEYTD